MLKQTLPIDSRIPEILKMVTDFPSVILMAEPGAGKTTRVPPAVAKQSQGQWIVLQPRRWAAKLTATRISEEWGCAIGEEVGYQIRFENRSSARTRVLVMTEGVLVRKLLRDPELSGVAGVILDEFHERSLDMDLALALLKEIQQSFRPDLKLIIMSATLDAERVERFLPDSKSIQVQGRVFPVEKRYDDKSDLLSVVKKNLPDDGDVLVFLPGAYEIERAVKEIQQWLDSERNRKVRAYPLYANLAEEKQKLVFEKTPHSKVICSTNIAETSITLPNVKVVIDSGLQKVMRTDPATGVDRLEALRISRASSEQRAGRAGRVSEGICIRLWSKHEQDSLRHFETPEVHRVNLGRALLTLSEFGVSDFEAFGWFEKPKSSMLAFAIRELDALGFLKDRKITPLGKEALKLPVDPKIASLMLVSRKYGCPAFGVRFAAFLENMSKEESIHDFDQLVARISRLTPFEMRVAKQLNHGEEVGALSSTDHENYERVLIEGDRLRVAVGDQMVGRRKIRYFDKASPPQAFLLSTLGQEEIVVKSYVPLNRETFQAYCEKRRRVFWDEREKKVRAVSGVFFEDLEMSALTEMPVDPQEAKSVLSRVVLDQQEGLFSKNERFQAWWLRYQFYLKTLGRTPELPWGEITDYLVSGKTKLHDVTNTDVVSLLEGVLDRSLLQEMDECAPERIDVPSGSHIKVDYESDPPKISVRLQEVFGWDETPRLMNGKVPLLMELLSPSFKPIQVTRDLRSFWSKAYFEVKKELKARYPKHSWPDDPLSAKAEAKGGRRRF